jgi:hypothetical protein
VALLPCDYCWKGTPVLFCLSIQSYHRNWQFKCSLIWKALYSTTYNNTHFEVCCLKLSCARVHLRFLPNSWVRSLRINNYPHTLTLTQKCILCGRSRINVLHCAFSGLIHVNIMYSIKKYNVTWQNHAWMKKRQNLKRPKKHPVKDFLHILVSL